MKRTDLLTPDAVAVMCDCSRNTVMRALAAGRLPALRVVDADGNVLVYGIGQRHARAWNRARQQGPGRPRKAWGDPYEHLGGDLTL